MKILVLLCLVFAFGCNKETTSGAIDKSVSAAKAKVDGANLDGLEEDCDDEVDYKKPAEEVVVDLTAGDEGCTLNE